MVASDPLQSSTKCVFKSSSTSPGNQKQTFELLCSGLIARIDPSVSRTKVYLSSVCQKHPQGILARSSDLIRCSLYHAKPKAAFSLAWLRTCRQLFNETKEIPYRTIAFIFFSISSLELFSRRSARWTSQIRYLLLTCTLQPSLDLASLADVLGQSPNRFPNLRTIGLEFSHWFYSYDSNTFTPRYMTYKSPKQIESGMHNKRRKSPLDRLLQALIELRMLPLRNASLVFRRFWEARERQIWSNYVENTLFKSYNT